MHGQSIRLRRWAWPVASLFNVRRPSDGERLGAPQVLRHRPIRPTGGAIYHAGRVDEGHLIRINRRPLRLLRERTIEPQTGSAHVPEGSAHQVALERTVVQHRRETGVPMGLWYPPVEAKTHRSRIGGGGPIKFAHRSGESRFGHMTEGASFVPPDRQLPVVKEQLAKQKDLLRRVERLMLHSRQSLGLNPIDLFLNRLNLSLGGGRNTYP